MWRDPRRSPSSSSSRLLGEVEEAREDRGPHREEADVEDVEHQVRDPEEEHRVRVRVVLVRAELAGGGERAERGTTRETRRRADEGGGDLNSIAARRRQTTTTTTKIPTQRTQRPCFPAARGYGVPRSIQPHRRKWAWRAHLGERVVHDINGHAEQRERGRRRRDHLAVSHKIVTSAERAPTLPNPSAAARDAALNRTHAKERDGGARGGGTRSGGAKRRQHSR